MALKTADRLSLTCQRLAICHILPALAIAIVPYLPADIPKTILPYTLVMNHVQPADVIQSFKAADE